jgi:hypothetical protein
LTKLCIEWGFCGNANDAPFDHTRASWTADDFAFEVLRAEGMNPLVIEGIGPFQSDWFKKIRKRFVSEFGQSVCLKDFDQAAQ